MSILNDNIARIGTSFQNYLINFFPFSFWQRGHSMPGPLANIPVQLQVGLDVPFFLHIFFMWLWSYIQVPKQNVFWPFNGMAPLATFPYLKLTFLFYTWCRFSGHFFSNLLGFRKRSTNLNASRYSTSPMGGSRPPVQAIFILYPSPRPVPT